MEILSPTECSALVEAAYNNNADIENLVPRATHQLLMTSIKIAAAHNSIDFALKVISMADNKKDLISTCIQRAMNFGNYKLVYDLDRFMNH